MSKNLDATLVELAKYRTRGQRKSAEIVRTSIAVLEDPKGVKKLGDELWDFLEQLTIAALDVGQQELATDCIGRLNEHFPDSSRVSILQGMLLETKDLNTAYKYYDQLLVDDETNAAAYKRQVSILRTQNKLQKAVEHLVSYLDTFYTDIEGWLELADMYASVQQYTLSLQALSHTLLLAPQNPFHTLHFAETAYTAHDYPLALKYYLRTTELADGGDVERRAWFGTKLCTRHLLSAASINSDSQTTVPPKKTLQSLDELATERISASYSSSSTPGRAQVLSWLSK